MKSVIREPLVHFLLIGAVLFGIFELSGKQETAEVEQITITSGQLEYLKASFQRKRQRPPTPAELQLLVESQIREEIFYREALALNMDKNDVVIRRRLNQKFERFNSELSSIATPSEEQLKQFLATNAEKFVKESGAAFEQIFVDREKFGAGAETEARHRLQQLQLGDRTLADSGTLPRVFRLAPESEIARVFGDSFSTAILKLPADEWSGPITSAYGLHLVRVTDHVEERLPRLDEIRKKVEWEWAAAKQAEFKSELYQQLRAKYTVVVEPLAEDLTTTDNLTIVSKE